MCEKILFSSEAAHLAVILLDPSRCAAFYLAQIRTRIHTHPNSCTHFMHMSLILRSNFFVVANHFSNNEFQKLLRKDGVKP